MSGPEAQPRALVVNDDDASRYATSRILQKGGFIVREAATGHQALYMAADLPDLVVLDVNLPDLDGFEVLRRLRADPKTASTRILHMSAMRTAVQDRVEGLERGADLYLTLPVDPAELLAAARALLRSKKAETKALADAAGWRATFDSITDGVAVLDEQGDVVRCNKAFAALFSKHPEEVLGKQTSTLGAPALADLAARALQQMHGDGARAVLHAEIQGLWFRVSQDPVFGEGGRVCGAVQILANITDAKRASAALDESETRFKLLVSSVQEYAIVMLDKKGHITSWNDGATRILGYQSVEILGQHVSAFYSPEALRSGAPMIDLRTAEMEGSMVAEGVRVTKDGTRFWADVLVSAVRDERDRLRGFAHVVKDVSDRKLLVEQLQHKNASLEEVDKRKDDFIAMLGHELRNPLGAIQTTLHLYDYLPEGTTTHSPEAERLKATIARQVRHVASLVDDLLDVSRITRGIIQINKERVDVRRAVADAIESHRGTMESRQQRVVYSGGDAAIEIDADPVRLAQILGNLLSNAAKYMDPGGKIEVSVVAEDRFVAIRVKDEGIGIDAEVVPRVFELFAQADRSIARSRGGLGIGLTIVKAIVELHGGNVAAFSAGLGKGSEFVVRLPVATAATAAPRAGRSLEPKVPALAGSARKRRIVLVEDNVDAREGLHTLLEYWGHEVYSAPDGETGLQRGQAMNPDVMLVDIGLPGLSGYEVARMMKTSAGGDSVYLVAMTGYGRPEDREAALKAGFHIHIVKPVDADELARMLNDHWLVHPT